MLGSTAAATIMRVAYGIQVDDSGDRYIAAAEEAMDSLSQAGVPGAFLVDTIPIRSYIYSPLLSQRHISQRHSSSVVKFVPAWFPGAGFQKKAQHWRELAHEFIDRPFIVVKNALVRIFIFLTRRYSRQILGFWNCTFLGCGESVGRHQR